MKFFFKIFTIIAILILNNSIFGGSFYVNDKLSFNFADDDITLELQNKIVSYARDADSLLSKALRKKSHEDNLVIKVFLNGLNQNPNKLAITQVDFYVTPKELVINIKNLNQDFENDIDLQQKLISIIAQSKINAKGADKLFQIPFWVFLAFDTKINKNQAQEKIIRRTRHMPGLKILIEFDTIKKYAIINELKNSNLSSMELFLYSDLSRFILEIVIVNGKNNVFAQYLQENMDCQQQNKATSQLFDKYIVALLNTSAEEFFTQNENHDETITKEEKINLYIDVLAHKMAFSFGSPYTSFLAKKRLEQISIIEIPKLDKDNKPTSEILTYPIHRLPFLMRTRPDSENIKFNVLFKFFNYRNSISSLFSKEANTILDDLQNCQDSIIFGTYEYTIKNDIEKLKNAINTQGQIEQLMYNVEKQQLNLYQQYPLQIQVAQDYFTNITTPSIHKLLQETEEKFYGNF